MKEELEKVVTELGCQVMEELEKVVTGERRPAR